ncbi:hypothetical protein [Nocardia brasiliensis]|uniref:hypothetical protein n=1 Tax=Nocardia brasiliensis TaxID=37326 RepID=UPI0024540B38|nr:hypothetical protein [Nocardia brasiliensis]
MSDLVGRLLVVDWDYFFPNPAMMVGPAGVDAFNYDWGHIESPFMIHDVWQSRLTPFVEQDLPLPRCERFEGFWSRFGLSAWEVGSIFVCESNMEAGEIFPASSVLDAEGSEGWAEVWLFDAHHDCGYPSALHLRERSQYDCGSWMAEHAERGSELHVRYPWWRATEDGSTFAEVEPEPWVPVDRRLDQWPDAAEDLPDSWDAVVVCRSGAWVPSWNDDQFDAFVESAGIRTVWIDSNFEAGPRKQPDLALARAELDIRAEQYAEIAEANRRLDADR